MNRNFRFFSSVLLASFTALFLTTSLLVAQRAADVKYKDGKGKEKEETQVQVLEHTAQGLRIKYAGTGRPDKVVSEDELISVTYAKIPELYRKGLDRYEDGDFEGAFEDFEALSGDERLLKQYPWAHQDALYFAFDSAVRLRRNEDAARVRDELQKLDPKGRWIPHMKLREAHDLLAMDKHSEAAAAFRTAKQAAETGSWAKSFVAKAALGEAEAYLNAGQVSEAKAPLNAARSAADESGVDDVKNRVRVLDGVLMVKEKKVAEAKTHFTRILDEVKLSDKVLIAGAANGRGDIHFEASSFEDAMLDFSMTASLFYEDPSLASEVGWALWMWGNACKRAANAIQNPEDETKRNYTRRYRSLLKNAAEDFAGTRGGILALRELGQ